jgi:outer membrane immunogenic protein
MVYVTGGAAWTNFETNVDVALDGAAANLFSASSTKLGWTVGGGIESGFFWPGWTAKLEYLHIRTDNITVNGTMPDVLGGGTFATDASHRNNIVRAGLNYRF